MALTVTFNFASSIANRLLARSDSQLTDSIARLSAGKRVIAAKDDAAAMAIGDRGLGEIGVDGGGADADQHAEIVHVHALGGTHIEAGAGAQGSSRPSCC